jgi:hypothetical protein
MIIKFVLALYKDCLLHNFGWKCLVEQASWWYFWDISDGSSDGAERLELAQDNTHSYKVIS